MRGGLIINSVLPYIFSKRMDFLKLLITLLVLLNLYACSSVWSHKKTSNLPAIVVNKTYQVRVRSGNHAIDKLIYEYTSARFGKYLRISDKGPFTNLVEIEFGSTSKSINGTAAGYIENVYYGNKWYTGGGSPEGSRVPGDEITPGGILVRQDSHMVLTIKNIEGDQLWMAVYDYKWSSDLSGIYVSRADEAAKISLEKLAGRFEEDFLMDPYGNPRMPGVALIIEKKEGR